MFYRTFFTLTLSLTLLFSQSSWAKPHIEALLTAIERDIKAQRISTPPGNNALSKIDLAKELYPFDFRVNKYVYQIAEIYISFANRAMDEKELQRAKKHLSKAENIASLAKGLNQAWSRLETLSDNKIKRPKSTGPKGPKQPPNTTLAANNKKASEKKTEKKKRTPKPLAKVSTQKPAAKPAPKTNKAVEKKPKKVAANQSKPTPKKETKKPNKKPVQVAKATTPKNSSIKTEKVSTNKQADNTKPKRSGPVEWQKETSEAFAIYSVKQDLITARDKDGVISNMSEACNNIVDKKASVVLHTKTVQDYRWLTVRLILCTRRIEPGFRLRHSNIIAANEAPKISLHPARDQALGIVQK